MSEKAQSEKQEKSWVWKRDNNLFGHLMATLPNTTGLMVSRALVNEDDCNVKFLMEIVTGDNEVAQIGPERRKHIAMSLVKWMQKLETKLDDDEYDGSRKAYFEVSYELLKNLLSLPDDTTILFIDDGKNDTFNVYVEHPDLYIVGEGEVIPRVDPSAKVVFDWGI